MLARAATACVVLAGAVLVALVLVVSFDSGDEQRAASARAPWSPPPDCRVTTPNGRTPPGEHKSPDRHGNGELWVSVPRDGRFTVAAVVHSVSP